MRISAVTKYRVLHVDTGRAVNDQGGPITDQFTTTLRTATVAWWRSERPERSCFADGGV